MTKRRYVDATEDIKMEFLGPSKKIKGTVEVIREYPNGTTASMGRARLFDMAGRNITAKVEGPIVFAGPTHIPNDPRNIVAPVSDTKN